MKICLAEALKKLERLTARKRQIDEDTVSKSILTYSSKDEKIETDYNYENDRKEVEEITKQIIDLKREINKANNETIIDSELNYTISDGLVWLGVMANEIISLKTLANRDKISAKTDFRTDSIVYTELLCDPEKLKQDIARLQDMQDKIRISIDRANMNTFIEIKG